MPVALVRCAAVGWRLTISGLRYGLFFASLNGRLLFRCAHIEQVSLTHVSFREGYRGTS